MTIYFKNIRDEHGDNVKRNRRIYGKITYSFSAAVSFFFLIYSAWAAYADANTENQPYEGIIVDFEYKNSGRIATGNKKRMAILITKENVITIIDNENLNVGDRIDGLYLTSLTIPVKGGNARLATRSVPNSLFHVACGSLAFIIIIFCLTRLSLPPRVVS